MTAPRGHRHCAESDPRHGPCLAFAKKPAKLCVLHARLAELRQADARAPRCAVCGCRWDRPCTMALDDAGSTGTCASMVAFDINSCSACLTPEKRINPLAAAPRFVPPPLDLEGITFR